MDKLYNLTKQKDQELRQFPELIDKYDKPGIYSISINNKLVYIGKSKNILFRLAAHIVNTSYNKGHKYQIFKQAIESNFPVSFGLLYEAKSDDIDEELGQKEGEYIRKYSPCLNTQIPKEENWHSFKICSRANKITLDQIIKGQI